MIVLNQENQGILDLFNLENTDIMSLECKNINDTMNITVVLNPDYLPCPDCGHDKLEILQYVKKKIRHSILEGRACFLIYKARRYRYHLIYGKHCYGYYLVIPEGYIGCEMSDYKDTFWHAESLRKTGLTEKTVQKIVNTIKMHGKITYEQK